NRHKCKGCGYEIAYTNEQSRQRILCPQCKILVRLPVAIVHAQRVKDAVADGFYHTWLKVSFFVGLFAFVASLIFLFFLPLVFSRELARHAGDLRIVNAVYIIILISVAIGLSVSFVVFASVFLFAPNRALSSVFINIQDPLIVRAICLLTDLAACSL